MTAETEAMEISGGVKTYSFSTLTKLASRISEIFINIGLFRSVDVSKVRPNEDSRPYERWLYFRRSRKICRLSYDDIILCGEFCPQDIIRLDLIGGCFDDDPPRPHVTQSEVIAVLFRPDVVIRWVSDGSLARRLTIISEIIQRRSRFVLGRPGARTYVLSYVGGETNGATSISNSLISIDFDELTIPLNLRREEQERQNLIVDLEGYFGESVVANAMRNAVGHDSSITRDVDRLLDSTMRNANVCRFGWKAVVVAVLGVALILGLFGSLAVLVFSASTGSLWLPQRALPIGIIGSLSAYGLLLLSVVAARIRQETKRG